MKAAVLLMAGMLLLTSPIHAETLQEKEKEVQKALISSLGDRFEFIRGEWGEISKPILSITNLKRFWFAHLKAKKEGVYALKYTVDATPPADPDPDAEQQMTSIYHLSVMEKGKRRIMSISKNTYQFTHSRVTVGDIVVVPLRIEARYIKPQCEWLDPKLEDPARISDIHNPGSDEAHDAWMRSHQEKLVDFSVKNAQLLSSWLISHTSRKQNVYVAQPHAYLEFTQAGEFDLITKLREHPKSSQKIPLRVVPQDQPFTLHITSMYQELKFTQVKRNELLAFPKSTLQLRVGDRLEIAFPAIQNAIPANIKEVDRGIIESGAFNDIPFYTPIKELR